MSPRILVPPLIWLRLTGLLQPPFERPGYEGRSLTCPYTPFVVDIEPGEEKPRRENLVDACPNGAQHYVRQFLNYRTLDRQGRNNYDKAHLYRHARKQVGEGRFLLWHLALSLTEVLACQL